MDATISGRCLCGNVAWEYTGPVGAAGYCHCEDCRRCTGSAFNVSVPLEVVRFRITAGAPASFTTRGDSGNELTRHFCPRCGSPIYTSAPKHPDHVYVKAGIIDDPSVVRPADQSWVASSVPWSRIDPSIPAFAKGRG